MNTKTTRKNKTKLEVTWPPSHFTIGELHKLNEKFINITLRVRLMNAIESKSVIELGTQHVGKGRPCLAFACAPVSESTLQSARDKGILLHDSFSTVSVKAVTSTAPTVTTTTAPTATVQTDPTPVKATSTTTVVA